MKNLTTFIYESIEDGKYVDLPEEMYKPSKYEFQTMPKPKQERIMRYPGGKYQTYKYDDNVYADMLKQWEESTAEVKAKKKVAEEAWKKHVELVKKIDAENFEILIDKMLKLMDDKTRRDDFIKTQVSQILESIKKSGSNDKKRDWREKALLEKVNSFRKSLELDNDSQIPGNSWSADSYEEDIYVNLYKWGSLYQIEVPKFSNNRDFKHNLFSETVDDLMSHWRETVSMKKLADKSYYAQRDKFIKQIEKDKVKVGKFRAAWAKTDQYKKLVKIADMIEDDVEKIEKIIDRSYTRFDELNGKNKAFRKASEEVKGVVDEYIEKAFGNTKHAVSCYGKSLLDILIAIKLAGKDDPKIEIIETATSSWLSGMRHSCKFKVTDSDGNEYVTGKYEDRGFDSFERTPGDGFGPWD